MSRLDGTIQRQWYRLHIQDLALMILSNLCTGIYGTQRFLISKEVKIKTLEALINSSYFCCFQLVAFSLVIFHFFERNWCFHCLKIFFGINLIKIFLKLYFVVFWRYIFCRCPIVCNSETLRVKQKVQNL